MDNSQTTLWDHTRPLNIPTKVIHSRLIDFGDIWVFASLNLQLQGDLAHFSQQLSTFPTCTESAAILVFAFESNPTERGGEVELQKQALGLSFPLQRHKNERLFGPKRSSRLHGLFHFGSSR